MSGIAGWLNEEHAKLWVARRDGVDERVTSPPYIVQRLKRKDNGRPQQSTVNTLVFVRRKRLDEH